jgi:hypothetical protein
MERRVRRKADWTSGRRNLAAFACALGLLIAISAAPAGAKPPFGPPSNKIWHGVSDTGHVKDFRRFNEQVREHTALDEVFFHWDVPLTTGALDRWKKTDVRGIVSISTAPGDGQEVVTPREITRGKSDHYPLRLRESIRNSGQVVYLRPFGEMNLHYNPYSAFNADGSPRAGHSTHAFKLAWKRIALIVRGGRRNKINNKLKRLGMPRIYRANRNDSPIYRRLDVPKVLHPPKVAFMWTPLTRGSPNVPGNGPNDYFPGRKYVDWVGTDVYSKFSNPTLWHNLNRFFEHKRGYPFILGEYGAWDNDFDGEFMRRIHKWARKRTRVRALVYFRSVDPDNIFNLQHYPGARHSLRNILNLSRYSSYAPGTKD